MTHGAFTIGWLMFVINNELITRVSNESIEFPMNPSIFQWIQWIITFELITPELITLRFQWIVINALPFAHQAFPLDQALYLTRRGRENWLGREIAAATQSCRWQMEGTRLFDSGSVHPSSHWAPFDCQQGSLAAPGGAGGGQEGRGLDLQQAGCT